MANIRRNTSYGAGTYGEPNYFAGCCEWCDDNARGNAIKYPPVGCSDAMCSDPTFASGCSGQGYGQITSRPTVNPFPITSTEEYNFSGFYNQSGGGCPCQYAGCTDPAANNYDASVTTDDGSCTYPQIACYTCSGSNVVGNNFNGPNCPAGWNSNPYQNCGGGGGPVRNFSGDYLNAEGNNCTQWCPSCSSHYMVPCDSSMDCEMLCQNPGSGPAPSGMEAVSSPNKGASSTASRGIKSIYPPPMDGRKVQAGGRLSQRIAKGDTDPTDDMGFRRFDGSNRMGFDNDRMNRFSGNGFTSY
jgi:hypothetical protein